MQFVLSHLWNQESMEIEEVGLSKTKLLLSNILYEQRGLFVLIET